MFDALVFLIWSIMVMKIAKPIIVYGYSILRSAPFILLLFITLFFEKSNAQTSPQDCLNAITVCTNTYVQNSTFNGYGSTQEIPAGGGSTCFGNGETNSSWYLFKIKNPGALYIDITPANLSDDYDFIIYNLTNDSCQGIISGTSTPVRCNYSSTTGVTGLAPGYSLANVNAGGPPFCSPLNVLANETYVLMVNNFTATSSGYTLSFGGTASIFDTESPVATSVAASPCSPNKVYVSFSENIDPGTLAADGSDFVVTGPSVVTVSDASFTTNNIIRIRFTAPISVPGMYTVEIKKGTDANTVSDFCNNFIPVNQSVTFTVTFQGPVATVTSVQHATCHNSNGTATGSYIGGTGPYSFLWNTVPPQYTITATNLPQGNYIFQVTDANGCTSFDGAIINSIGEPQLTTTTFDDTCYNTGSGQASVVATGGIAPYTYLWSTAPPQFTATAIGLTSGNYTVTVTDNSGCTSTATVTVITFGKPAITITKTDLSCDQSIGGTATATVIGSSPFTYLWSTSQTTSAISSLSIGTYTLTVTDVYGCKSKKSVNILAGHMELTAVTTDLLCGNQNTGSASITVSGAVAPFTYLWNTNPVQTTPIAVNLFAGTYKVVVTDVAGCKDSLSVVINGPPPIVLTVASVNANCTQNDGSATVTIAGGFAPFTYVWNTPVVQYTPTATNLPAGSYLVTITDNTGCTATSTAYVSNVNGPDGFISSAIDATCNEPNGSATVTVLNGAAPFSYQWNTVPVQFGATSVNLDEGVYTVKITDDNGCISFLNVKINAIPMVSLALGSVSSASCGKSNGSASVIASGGVGPYTYLWLTNPFQTTSTALNIPTGTYLAIVTDGNGCKDSVVAAVGEFKALNNLGYRPACITEATPFEAITDYPGAVSWHWDFGDPTTTADSSDLWNPTYIYPGTGSFKVTLYINGGCATDTLTRQIYTGYKPVASFLATPEPLLAESPVTFVYTGTTVEQYYWEFGGGSFSYNPSPIHTFWMKDSVEVTLMVTDMYGCKDTVTNEYFVDDAPQIFFPSSFTPNGDGKNDFFKVYAHGLADCDVKIFSRWGDVVFQSSDKSFLLSTGWDGTVNGKLVQDGVYAFLIKGKLMNNKVFNKAGTVMLMK